MSCVVYTKYLCYICFMVITKTIAKIYAGPEEVQEVEIQYAGSGVRRFAVTELKVITPLELEPSDLITDLEIAICEHEHTVVADIDCKIEFVSSGALRLRNCA